MKKVLFIFIIISLVCGFKGNAQIITSTRVDTFTYMGKIHSPYRAAMLSAAIPGMGQVYNKKYWKVPIIYAGTGTLLFFINKWNVEYKIFRNAFYDAKLGGYLNKEVLEFKPALQYREFDQQLVDDIEKRKEQVRKWRDYNILGLAALYLVNIVDAHIDAYFMNFDVSKDLTVQLNPFVDNSLLSQNIIGLKLSLELK